MLIESEARPISAAFAATTLTQVGEFSLDVRTETLARALAYVGQQSGWSERSSIGPTTCLVTDRVLALDARDHVGWRRILVTDPSPFMCRRALNALSAGTVISVVLTDEPDGLADALDAVLAGRLSAPGRVIEQATRMPQLSDRQQAILSAVSAGQTNHQMGRALKLSDASIKRELSRLFQALRASNRLELGYRALQLGITPMLLRP